MMMCAALCSVRLAVDGMGAGGMLSRDGNGRCDEDEMERRCMCAEK